MWWRARFSCQGGTFYFAPKVCKNRQHGPNNGIGSIPKAGAYSIIKGISNNTLNIRSKHPFYSKIRRTFNKIHLINVYWLLPPAQVPWWTGDWVGRQGRLLSTSKREYTEKHGASCVTGVRIDRGSQKEAELPLGVWKGIVEGVVF